MGVIIGSVRLTPAVARPAQPVLVEVLGVDGQPLKGTSSVAIDGIPGARRYLQHAATGTYTVRATARIAGSTETEAVKLFVQGAPISFRRGPLFASELALLDAEGSLTDPYSVTFTLGGGLIRPPARADLRRLGRRGFGGGGLKPLERQQIAGNGEPTLAKHHGVRPLIANLRYRWDFGDGTSQTTSAPTVTHSFFRTLDHGAAPGRFDVRCRVLGQEVDVVRTLVMHSAYAICRQSGTVVCPVEHGIYAHKHPFLQALAGELVVHNLEHDELVLDRLSITELPEADAPLSPAVVRTLEPPIAIAARSSVVLYVHAQIGVDVTSAAPGFTAVYAGSTASGMPARVSATFEQHYAERGLKQQKPSPRLPLLSRRVWPWDEVMQSIKDAVVNPSEVVNPGDVQIDPITHTIAVPLPSMGVAPVVDRHVLSQVHRLTSLAEQPIVARLKAAGVKQLLVGTTANGRRTPITMREGKPPESGPVAAGEVCDPDNISAEQSDAAGLGQLFCQLTDEEGDFELPGRFLNARKGDIILSPGGTGMIGTLLAKVTPPQRYSHSGIMTRNFDELTHSTASEDRLQWYADGGDPTAEEKAKATDAFRSDALKYMWPGVVAQDVEAAIHGEQFLDAESGKRFSIKSFTAQRVGSQVGGTWLIVPPMVVKPDPLLETPQIRTELHSVAAAARAAAGEAARDGSDGRPARQQKDSKSHYRLFCYTNPTITDTAPASAGWATGTFPSVCSSFIWRTLKARSARLESASAVVQPADLEALDTESGAEVRPLTPDGLYTYTREERLAAAQWLWDHISDEAFTSAGWFGEAMTDVTDDVANQLVNTFANDDTENGKDHELWRQLGEADAVSPDNVLWWDGPDRGGLYGYAEPLVYREPRVERYTLSRWRKVLTRGTIIGVVRSGGQPVFGAQVSAYDGKSDTTDEHGRFEIKDVGLGSYHLKAHKPVDGQWFSASRFVTHQAELTTADIDLQPPDEKNRLVEIFFDFEGNDDETVGDDHFDFPPESIALELGLTRTTNSYDIGRYAYGGEIVCKFTITARLLADSSVDVEVVGRLWEGSDYDEDAEDLSDTQTIHFEAPKDQTGSGTCTVTNRLEDVPDDWGSLTVSAHNGPNSN